MFYYIPDSKDAFQSIEFIMNHVPYGWLFRLIACDGRQPHGDGSLPPYGLRLFPGLL